MTKTYLCHYGVKGQRWGDRQYQYEDGSLTPEGREHYGVGDGNRDRWSRLDPNSRERVNDRVAAEKMRNLREKRHLGITINGASSRVSVGGGILGGIGGNIVGSIVGGVVGSVGGMAVTKITNNEVAGKAVASAIGKGTTIYGTYRGALIGYHGKRYMYQYGKERGKIRTDWRNMKYADK